MSPCFISSIIILDKSALTYFKYRHNIVLLAMNRNNTTTPAIVAIFMIATLVVGATLAATMTPSAFAGGGKKVKQDKYMRGAAGQDGSKKGTRDNQTAAIAVMVAEAVMKMAIQLPFWQPRIRALQVDLILH
jgi:hypothetical protein